MENLGGSKSSPKKGLKQNEKVYKQKTK